MLLPSLSRLVEDHFKPKWWQFWRKQKYHICTNYGSYVIYKIPDKCIVTKKDHEARACARMYDDHIEPNCSCECPTIKASDPDFFKNLDEYLMRECYNNDRRIKADKFVSATMQGPPGPMGPPGPSASGPV